MCESLRIRYGTTPPFAPRRALPWLLKTKKQKNKKKIKMTQPLLAVQSCAIAIKMKTRVVDGSSFGRRKMSSAGCFPLRVIQSARRSFPRADYR
jgi:hypothetical protein